MQSDPVTTRKNLIRYLRHLTVNVWPEYEHEWVLPEEAARLLREAHVAALKYIGIQLQADPVAREFVERIDASITRPFQFDDTLNAARRFAPEFLRRLEKKRDAEQGQERDLVGAARREYVLRNVETNPWLEDANVCLDGLTNIPKQRVRLNGDGSVSTDF